MKKNITNIEVKKNNRNRIFRYICKHDRVSNPDIAYALQISLPTVIQNTKELIERRLVEEAGEMQSTGGRRAKALTVCANRKLAVGLDITRNHIGLVLTNLTGEIIRYDRIYLAYRKEVDYYHEINQKLEQFLTDCGADRERILGIGISWPGIVNLQREEISYSHVLNSESIPFHEISRHFAYPCFFMNDANAGAYAEGIHGDTSGRFFYFSLSNTVGGGIFSGNELIFGQNFRCGEVGHMTLVPDGPVCYCGKRGCLDVYCSAKRLSEETDGKLELFFERLKEKDGRALEIWDAYTTYLSMAIHNIYMALDCIIVLGGYVGSYVEKHIRDVCRKVAERNIFSDQCDFVRPCTFQIEAAALGAASQVIEMFIKSV